MSLAIELEAPPLRVDEDGTVRIGGTRVTLDTVMAAFKAGAAPEQIANQYPSLVLGEIYATIAYYLRHTAAVDAYLQARGEAAEQIRREMEGRFDPNGVRDRLLARRGTRGAG